MIWSAARDTRRRTCGAMAGQERHPARRPFLRPQQVQARLRGRAGRPSLPPGGRLAQAGEPADGLAERVVALGEMEPDEVAHRLAEEA